MITQKTANIDAKLRQASLSEVRKRYIKVKDLRLTLRCYFWTEPKGTALASIKIIPTAARNKSRTLWLAPRAQGYQPAATKLGKSGNPARSSRLLGGMAGS